MSLEINTESSPGQKGKLLVASQKGQRLACELKSSTAHLLVFLFVIVRRVANFAGMGLPQEQIPSWHQGVSRVSTTKSKYAGPKEYSSNKRRVKVKFFDTI